MEKKVKLRHFSWDDFSKELDKLFVYDSIIEEPAIFGLSLPYDYISDCGVYSSMSEYLYEQVGFYALVVDEIYEDYGNLYNALIGYISSTYFTFGKRQFQDADMASDTFKLSIKNNSVVEETRHFVCDLEKVLQDIDVNYKVSESYPRRYNNRYYKISRGSDVVVSLTLGDIISLDLEKVSSLVNGYKSLAS